MIFKIFLLLPITLSFTFSQQNKSFTISENSQGGFNINNSEGKILFEYTKENADSLSLETLRFVFSEFKYFRESLKNQTDSIKEIKKSNTHSGSVWEDVLNYLPILVPILALWLAILQYRMNKFKSKYSLYDQKFKVYENTDEFIKKLLSGWIEISDCTGFDRKVRIAKFINTDKINRLLNEILAKGYKIAELNSEIKLFYNSFPEPDKFIERKKLIEEKLNLMMESRKYRDNLDEIFMDTLRIEN